MIIFFLGASFVTIGYASAQETQHTLQINYADNAAEPYATLVNSGSKYTLSQSYSWVRDETSRYNLVSYSIDGTAYVEIPRKARGSFLIDIPTDSSHTVTFQAVAQYPISVLTGSQDLDIAYFPPSPTDDDWFDIGSDVTITISNKEDGGTRQQVISWSIDKSTKRFVNNDASTSLSIPVTKLNGPHKIELDTKIQHYIDVTTEQGTVVGEGWYDSGSTAKISISHVDEPLIQHVFNGWKDDSGTQLQGNSVSVVVDSPKTLVAKWTTDYSQLVAAVIVPAIVAVIVILKKILKKSSHSSSMTVPASETSTFQQQISTSTPLIALQQHEVEAIGLDKDENKYSKEIMEYASIKSVEKLEVLRSLGLVSDDRLPRIKDRIRQSFD
jgi:hypothetical protein